MKAGASTLPRASDRNTLGKLRVSPICLGVVTDPDTLREAYSAGINFFFVSADMHWPLYRWTYEGVRRLLVEDGVRRDDIVIACASYPTQPEFCTRIFSEVTETFPWLERVDVCVMGGAYASDFFGRLIPYTRHKTGGIPGVTAIGATFHERVASVPAVNHQLIDIAFLRYNPLHSGATTDVFPSLDPTRVVPLYGFNSTDRHVPPEAYASLGIGENRWRPSITDSYRYALSSPLDGILCAPGTPAELKGLLAALEQGPLTMAEQEYLRKVCEVAGGFAIIES